MSKDLGFCRSIRCFDVQDHVRTPELAQRRPRGWTHASLMVHPSRAARTDASARTTEPNACVNVR